MGFHGVMNGLQAKRKRALVTGASKGVGRDIAVGLERWRQLSR